MAQLAKCRICGKEYTPCKSAKYDPLVFNWREVSCSPDCGEQYLKKIIASRTPKEEPVRKRGKRSSNDIDAAKSNISAEVVNNDQHDVK